MPSFTVFPLTHNSSLAMASLTYTGHLQPLLCTHTIQPFPQCTHTLLTCPMPSATLRKPLVAWYTSQQRRNGLFSALGVCPSSRSTHGWLYSNRKVTQLSGFEKQPNSHSVNVITTTIVGQPSLLFLLCALYASMYSETKQNLLSSRVYTREGLLYTTTQKRQHTFVLHTRVTRQLAYNIPLRNCCTSIAVRMIPTMA